LVARILAETALPRVRLSSLEPWDIAPHFFALWQNPRLCPHLHLPLQSGCDATLKRMRRNTDQATFRALVQAARAQIPDVRLTTDVIVGFPAETDDEFAQSEAFIREMDFAGMHVFRYSSRPETPAARMKKQIPNSIKQARSQRLLALASAGENAFAARYSGQRVPVLWENISGATEQGFINSGYTHHYLRVQCIHPRVLTNLITPTILGPLVNGTLTGQPVLE
jgi:threonylcarbamoyladenosine tRNA methylthiotransferase MtaB